jgi:aryl-alcohol dehydrogenase-like predicted oxidoreductase
VTALQSEYSLWTGDIEAEILPTLDELGIARVPVSPQGKCFLTGTVDTTAEVTAGDIRATSPGSPTRIAQPTKPCSTTW